MNKSGLEKRIQEIEIKANQIMAIAPLSSNDWPAIKLLLQQVCVQLFFVMRACISPKLPFPATIPATSLLRILIEYSVSLQYIALQPEERLSVFIDATKRQAVKIHEAARRQKIPVNPEHGKPLKNLALEVSQDIDPQKIWGKDRYQIATEIDGSQDKNIQDPDSTTTLCTTVLAIANYSVHPSFFALNAWRSKRQSNNHDVDYNFLMQSALLALEKALNIN